MSFYGYNNRNNNTLIKNAQSPLYSGYYQNQSNLSDSNKNKQFSSFGQMTLNQNQPTKNYHFTQQQSQFSGINNSNISSTPSSTSSNNLNPSTTTTNTNNYYSHINNNYLDSGRNSFRNSLNKNFLNMYNNDAKNNELNTPNNRTPFSNRFAKSYSVSKSTVNQTNEDKSSIESYERLTKQFEKMTLNENNNNNNISTLKTADPYNKYTSNIQSYGLNNTNSQYSPYSNPYNNYVSGYGMYTNNNNNNNITPIKLEHPQYNPLPKKISVKKYSSLSKAGANADGQTKTNQDSFIAKEQPDGSFTLGIFDGHGTQGHCVSQAIKRFFENSYPQQLSSREGLLQTYASLSQTINNSQYFDSFSSGSTCVLLHLDFKANKLFSANCGDSRAILLSNNDRALIPLSYDQKPDNPDEKRRIENSGGAVDKIYGLGPWRVWVKGQGYPGLAMSRSIGDKVAHSVGVSDIPEILEFQIDKVAPKAIVAASDGVWEFMSNEDVKDIVLKYFYTEDSQGCVNEIVDTAYKKWSNEGFSRDDITAVVVFF